jgi:cyclophilin family peptidyl-prolyl cis-trans isomerase
MADSARARLRLGSFTGHPVWWVRMHAAAVAQRLGDRGALHRLVTDSVDNVREAALRALVALDEHDADEAAISQLVRSDLQLVLTAARALRGSPRGTEVARASLAAFQRISAKGRQTSRDPRLALLDRIEEFGGAAHGVALAASPADVDSMVAARSAAVASRLTGRQIAPRVQEPPLPAIPPPAVLRTMSRATMVMADGVRLELVLRPFEAPGSVSRFVEMAGAGWFDGLTLHRVVPNFVLQGGSPGANEYEGGADFRRDEVGGQHRRGTVGISTRGRDTGDGQLFINLVDNLNLDHEYTVIGEVVIDRRALDQILAGAIIRRVEVP